MNKRGNFLLTFEYENTEGMYELGYSWHSSEEEINKEIKRKKEIYSYFKVKEVIEILQARDIKIK